MIVCTDRQTCYRRRDGLSHCCRRNAERCVLAISERVESYAVEVQADDLAGQAVESVLAATGRRIVLRIQRREKDARLGDAVAEEIVRTAGAVSATGTGHLVLRCTN